MNTLTQVVHSRQMLFPMTVQRIQHKMTFKRCCRFLTAAVEALVKAGIKANFTTDNGVSNSIAITVANEEVSEEATRYLAIDPITSSTDPKLAVFDYTKTQTFTVKVKAVGVNGSALNWRNCVFEYCRVFK